jgi:hypothetical protein
MSRKMLKVFGPYKVPVRKQKSGRGKMIDKEHERQFWEKIRDQELEKKQGCYIFALRAAKGATPWYVGKAGKSFQQECFTSDKLNKYNKSLFDGRQGTPVLFFVALEGRKKKISSQTIKEVETYLIRVAKEANRDLINKSKTKPPNWASNELCEEARANPRPPSPCSGRCWDSRCCECRSQAPESVDWR